jgi:hypothetical protein
MDECNQTSSTLTKRRTFLLALGSAGVTGLAGCGGDAGDDTENPTSAGNATETPAPTDRSPETDAPTKTDRTTESTPTDPDTATPADPDTATPTPDQVVQFTSFPDLFNWNIDYPQEGWEDAMDWYLNRMKSEGPDFSLNAGDLMDARWWESKQQVRDETEYWWGGLKQRMAEKDIDMYYAPGDHEYGDDQGLEMDDLTPVFAEQFVEIFDMPENGPDHKKGRAYKFTRGNLVVLSVDTTEFGWEGEGSGDGYSFSVSGAQLDWLEQQLTFAKYRPRDFVIVQGHNPVVRPVSSRYSSANMLNEDASGDFWQTLAEYNVDAYFCGEHHDITATQEDGIWQVVHGSLWGSTPTQNYLRGEVDGDTMTFELFRFPVEYSGEITTDHPHRGAYPASEVTIPQDVRDNGPERVGRLVIEARNGPNETVEQTGVFQ